MGYEECLGLIYIWVIYIYIYIYGWGQIYLIFDPMEVEYSGGGVLIFSYLILINQFDNFGVKYI